MNCLYCNTDCKFFTCNECDIYYFMDNAGLTPIFVVFDYHDIEYYSEYDINAKMFLIMERVGSKVLFDEHTDNINVEIAKNIKQRILNLLVFL